MRSLRYLGLALSVLLFVALGGVLAVFLIKNGHWVVVRFPGLGLELARPFTVVEWEAPLYVVILASAVVGGTLATLAYLPLWLRRSVVLNRDRRFINALEGELTELRNLPVTAPAPLEDIAEEDQREARAERVDEDEDEAALLAALQGPPGGAGR